VAKNIVVLDAARLPADVEFPPLETKKYGWEQYPQLVGDDIAEHCSRADIVISLGTAIGLEDLEKMEKIGLLVCAGEACGQVDQVALATRGVEILAFTHVACGSGENDRDFCNRTVAAIDHYVRNFEVGEVMP